MTHEQREAYIRQVKKSFQNYSSNRERNESYPKRSYVQQSDHFVEREEQQKRTFGFWKVRFLIAIVLFAAIFSLHQNQSEDTTVSFEQITAMVEKNIDTQAVAAWFEQ